MQFFPDTCFDNKHTLCYTALNMHIHKCTQQQQQQQQKQHLFSAATLKACQYVQQTLSCCYVMEQAEIKL